MDFPIATYILTQGNYPNLKMAQAYQPTIMGSLGLATRKEDTELLERINKALAKLKADGAIDAILKKWGLGGA
ncbi:Bacterial extracellular solute-binding protein, family 3 [compost metagenome]